MPKEYNFRRRRLPVIDEEYAPEPIADGAGADDRDEPHVRYDFPRPPTEKIGSDAWTTFFTEHMPAMYANANFHPRALTLRRRNLRIALIVLYTMHIAENPENVTIDDIYHVYHDMHRAYVDYPVSVMTTIIRQGYEAELMAIRIRRGGVQSGYSHNEIAIMHKFGDAIDTHGFSFGVRAGPTEASVDAQVSARIAEMQRVIDDQRKMIDALRDEAAARQAQQDADNNALRLEIDALRNDAVDRKRQRDADSAAFQDKIDALRRDFSAHAERVQAPRAPDYAHMWPPYPPYGYPPHFPAPFDPRAVPQPRT